MIRKRLRLLHGKARDFHRRSKIEWQETRHMSRVYRDMVLRRASRCDIEKAHDQAGEMVRILILGSTQIIRKRNLRGRGPRVVTAGMTLLFDLKAGFPTC